MDSLLKVFTVLVVFNGAVGLVLSAIFNSWLRRFEPILWEQLGRPGVFSLPYGARLHFLWQRQYLGRSQPRTVALCDLLRGFLISYALLVLATLTILILGD